ncbi:hypothetical protein EDC02_7776 [Micromonospora sp. Llam0]|uniref:hypothetical protein n=1 Tax=Micromonospora sp. Llam0 TaxID=2485143 RepID=UPI000F483CEC|nr:hypothetical protein [Micromonospora sp. Llam0]ROO52832.1 hypothetical protein EDC02_7776 [Micromonospora sp. Llam0]
MHTGDPRVARYADHIMTEIDGDITEGAVPPGIGSFVDLHCYLDANDYLDAAGLPHYSSQADLDLANAVTDEVSRRLRTPGRPFCTYGRCTFSAHDHTTSAGPDGQHLDREVPLCCAHCGHPAHYDTRLRDYRHDDPAAPDCFLIRRDTHGHTETSAGPQAACGNAKPADAPWTT